MRSGDRACAEEIARAFQTQSLIWHPDKNPGDAQAQRIYENYLDDKSEGRIVVSSANQQQVQSVIKAVESGEKGTPASLQVRP